MARSDHRFNYRWRLSDGFPAPGIAPNGLKVFGTFVCGGGSAMGYKLAGCDYLGGVEIDPKVAETYRENLRPKYLCGMSVPPLMTANIVYEINRQLFAHEEK